MTPPFACEPIPDGEEVVARFREIGDLTLDLLHRDARVEDCWLALSNSEFAFLWRLSREPGESLSLKQWLQEHPEGQCTHNPAQISDKLDRLREKLSCCSLTSLLGEEAGDLFRLDAPPGPSSFHYIEKPSSRFARGQRS